jgi:multimeric flavodoxin WrbA
MKIYVLCDENNGQTEGAVSALRDWAARKGHEARFDYASSMRLKACIGCFGCWLKTPGVCVIKDDDGRRYLERFVASDLMIIITRIPFGSYSPAIKRALDRGIPSLLPYFRIFRGEMHHVQRYPRGKRILHLPYGDYCDEEFSTFAELARAHCDNAESLHPSTQIGYGGDIKALVDWVENEVNR